MSNVATIQTRLYETLGHIELLEWISLSFSLAVFASLSLARKIVYCFDLRWVYLANLGIFFVGSALAGAAPNMAMVIIGRSIMGAGGAVVLQTYVERRIEGRRLTSPQEHGVPGRVCDGSRDAETSCMLQCLVGNWPCSRRADRKRLR